MPEMLAKDLMKNDFRILGTDHTIRDALQVYLELKSRNEFASVLAIFQSDGRYAGLLTLSRLIKGTFTGAILSDLEYIPESDLEKTLASMLRPRLAANVGEVMDSVAPIASPESTLGQMLELARNRPAECFPVMDEKNELVGIVHTSDLFNTVAKLALAQENANA
jgi:CBS-domain-containing membrane protein